MRLLGHSNDLWPQPLHVKHSILLVLLVESLEGFALCVVLVLEELVGGRLGVVTESLELVVAPLVGVAQV